IWQEVLGVELVGIHDNFLDLGGHSLLATQLVSRIRRDLNLELPLKTLFASATVINLAGVIQELQAKSWPAFVAPDNLIPDNPEQITPTMLPLVTLTQAEIDHIVDQLPGGVGNIQDIYGLGPLQEGILFTHQLSESSDPYVTCSLLRIEGESVLNQLLEFLQFFVNRHDVFRTAIIWKGISKPVQVVLRQAKLPVTRVEVDAGEDPLSYMQALSAPAQQWMELAQAPLFKVTIAQETPEHYLVLIQDHHVTSDHVTLEILFKELALYQSGAAQQLPPPIPYREFVAHTQYKAAQLDYEGYFKRVLGDVDEATAPFNLVNVQGDGVGIEEVTEPVPAAVGQAIRRTAQRLHVTPAVLFHTAWAMVLSACSGRDDVVFGTVLSGRLQGTLGAEDMVGVLMNTLPMRVKLSGHNVRETVQQVYTDLQELLEYEQAPLALVQRCSA
ncbi:MAG: condensation domain-containing protein, partial [Trichodesmium sp. St19_bin1]|nr:condensation domain-containing protein [Trichodesmium sp. St19_bin1]